MLNVCLEIPQRKDCVFWLTHGCGTGSAVAVYFIAVYFISTYGSRKMANFLAFFIGQ